MLIKTGTSLSSCHPWVSALLALVLGSGLVPSGGLIVLLSSFTGTHKQCSGLALMSQRENRE